ncbi:MAG TPA: hypothetical protein VNK04_00475 [Gemmataceae bacterium]|nr:hypothetical protein [Gemmataceae bacterium]
MHLLRLALASVVVLGLAIGAESAGAPKAQKKAGKAVKGQVVAVQKDTGKETGTLTIKTVAKKKAGDTGTGEEKKYVISESTKFEKAPPRQKGQKAVKNQPGTPATFADVKQGDRVAVYAKGDTADRVVIVPTKKKNQ